MIEYHIYNDMYRGWIRGKYQPFWHLKVYDMWKGMWDRVYNNVYYFGSLIHPSFKYLSNFVDWIESQLNFEDFCETCDKTKWTIDKDSVHEDNRDYYPEYMTLVTQSVNTIERNNRKGNPMYGKYGKNNPTSKSVICITTKRIFFSINDGANYYRLKGGNITNCCQGKKKSAGKLNGKKLVWRYLVWKHDKIYRIKR